MMMQFSFGNDQLLQVVLSSHENNFFGHELSDSTRILLIISERNLPKRKHNHLDMHV